MRRKGGRRLITAGRPMPETAIGKSLVAEPKSLAVVNQHLDGGPPPIAENEHGPREGVFFQDFFAMACQTVYSTAKVGRLDGNQYPHLRRDLKHCI